MDRISRDVTVKRSMTTKCIEAQTVVRYRRGACNIVFMILTSGSPGYAKTLSTEIIIFNHDYIGLRLNNATDINIFRNTFKNCTNGIQMVTNSRNIITTCIDLAEGVPSSALDAGVCFPASYQNDSQNYINTFLLGRITDMECISGKVGFR
jgi:hypothetical protein